MSLTHFNKNLIKNPSGKEGLKFWQIENGGNGIIVEEQPIYTDPIPEKAGLPSQHCFVTSYGRCERKQEIDLQVLGFTPNDINIYRPHIIASEWVSARGDCDSWTELIIVLLKNKEVLSTKMTRWSSLDEGIVEHKWYKIWVELTDCPKDITSIQYLSCGQDHQFWAGNYGAKTAGSSLVLQVQNQNNASAAGGSCSSAEGPTIDLMLKTVQMNSDVIFKLMEAQSKDREATSGATMKLLEHHSKDHKETTSLIMKVIEKQSNDSHETATSLQHLIQLQNRMLEQQNEDRSSASELYKSLQIIAKKDSNSTPDCPMCSTVTKMIFCGHFYCPNCHKKENKIQCPVCQQIY